MGGPVGVHFHGTAMAYLEHGALTVPLTLESGKSATLEVCVLDAAVLRIRLGSTGKPLPLPVDSDMLVPFKGAVSAPALTREELVAARRQVARDVQVEAGILTYIQRIVAATRRDPAVQFGAGPRAGLALLETSRALAVLRGRDFVTPDDVKDICSPVLVHRVTLSPEAEMEGFSLDELLARILQGVEVPR